MGSPEDTAEKEAEGETTEEKAPAKDAKTKVKEALDNIHMPNMPKMPKLHKPAFLKKKKTDGEATPDAEGDAPAEAKEGEEEKEKEPEDKEKEPEDKEEKDENKEKEEKEKTE